MSSYSGAAFPRRDTGPMTIHHVLLSYPTWSALRIGILGDYTSDLRKLLNSYKGAIAAVKFVLQTDLLAQFSLVATLEQAKCLRSVEPEGRGIKPPS
jgi:hypothetical protein